MTESKFTVIAGKQLLNEAVALLEPERRRLREPLSQGNLASVLDATRQAYARLDQGIADAIVTSGLQPACRAGCAWCCRGVKVNVSVPEALGIAEHIKHNDTLRAATLAAAQRRRTLNTDQYFMSGDPCPLLNDSGQCQVYPVRPIACRRHHCLSASECEQAVKRPALKLPVTQHVPANAVGVIASLALAAALEDAHLDHRTFELSAAVAVALAPETGPGWVAGQRVFDAAVRPVDELDGFIAQADLAKPRYHK